MPLLRHPLFPLVLFLGFWYGQFFLALLPAWNGGTYYDYGFLTPVVLPLIYWARWRDENIAPSQWREKLAQIQSSIFTWILLGISLLLLTGLRVVESVDAGWRAPLFLHGGIVIGFAGFLHIKLFGWNRTLTFLPIAILLFLSIPLPKFVESSLIHTLTQQVTETAAIATRWMGIPVEVSGETLLLDNIPLQVGEGCSGVRSFQSSVYAGFLLGELLRLTLGTRFLLILAGVLFAFLTNCARVIFLVRYAAEKGDENLQSLHDLSGNISMSTTFLLLLATALILRKRPSTND